jgi:hypothetical protein
VVLGVVLGAHVARQTLRRLPCLTRGSVTGVLGPGLPAVTLGGLVQVSVRDGLLRVLAEVVRPVQDGGIDRLFRGCILCPGLFVSVVVSLAHAHGDARFAAVETRRGLLGGWARAARTGMGRRGRSVGATTRPLPGGGRVAQSPTRDEPVVTRRTGCKPR